MSVLPDLSGDRFRSNGFSISQHPLELLQVQDGADRMGSQTKKGPSARGLPLSGIGGMGPRMAFFRPDVHNGPTAHFDDPFYLDQRGA